ncbi:SDR family NAD(P)-dependent oxidoreductase [Jeotgalibacillus sp. R-1-5s-1]|uniref:SDR family NAD(P)-dependent oxidoreductase n=1 Tax=Jeotgalibacillus sp. R-1-5s-1 TaxID=2555897 RepID=UPI00106D0979|nr:SDR family NAD(P)-dependent oxidoreductase [Jeotgalibacillus sp. R-1-5s-1]TFE00031.1 SDR family NAD(P)-dependent oxidoreductase [Jeotgalibacillus sp. R-1-5s-1]
MRILITGGAGFIGSSLSLKLLEKGYKIRVIDNLSPQIHGEDPQKSELFLRIKNQVEFIYGDVRNKEDLELALKEVDVVVHLAAETGTGQSMYEVEKYVDVNINGTVNLLNIVAANPKQIKKIVVASSRAIYGEGKYKCETHGEVFPESRDDTNLSKGDFEAKCPKCFETVHVLSTSEDSRINPLSVYGFTKFGQENLVMLTGKSLNIPAVALRYQNVYGPGQSLKNPYTGILSIFSTRIKNGNDLMIFEDGKESRDFVYIDDVVDATIKAIEMDEANHKIFNVGTGKAVNVLEVAKTLIHCYQAEIPYKVTGHYRLGDIRHNFADLTKVEDDLFFNPKFSFQEGIRHFTDWVNSQEVEEDLYEHAMLEMKEKGLYK